jgi:predicted transcriptional regulator
MKRTTANRSENIVGVRMPRALRAQLERIARARALSLSVVIRTAVLKFLKSEVATDGGDQ